MAAQVIRWGILGAGAIAETVGADIAATPGNAVAAIGSRDGARAAALAERLAVPRSYGSYAELVADPGLDVVYIATTHGQHHEHALLALRADKPVLVEKAFTLNARQAREVVAEARSRRLFCMEAMWMRLNPAVRSVVDIAASGRIGEVTGVRADLSRYFPFDPTHRLFDLAAGGGALLDLGVYSSTFAWLVLGAPDTVQATGSLSATGSDLTVALQWGYRDGRVAQIYTSAAGTSPLAGLVTGTKGWIAIEPSVHRPRRLLVSTGGDPEVTVVEPEEGNGYRRQAAEVAHRLRAGELESPFVPLDETVALLEVLDEARRQIGARYAADD